jgi:uncharacterized protein YndB with AHSA1/START domain
MQRKPPPTGWQKDSVTISREIAAPPDEVFRALTEPAELLRWWGGSGGLTRAHVNLRPGGEYRLEFEGPPGQVGWIKGQYQAVEPGRSLLMTWFSSVHPDLRNSLELRFEPLTGGATKLIAVHAGLAGHAEVLKEYEGIWKETLDRLASKTKGRR